MLENLLKLCSAYKVEFRSIFFGRITIKNFCTILHTGEFSTLPIYLSLWTQTADPISSEPFSRITLYLAASQNSMLSMGIAVLCVVVQCSSSWSTTATEELCTHPVNSSRYMQSQDHRFDDSSTLNNPVFNQWIPWQKF